MIKASQTTSELTYYRSMLLFLSVIWLATLSWFFLYLKINFSLPLVGFWFGSILFTLAISYFLPPLPALQNRDHSKFNLVWLLLLLWIMLLNAGLLYETGGTINPMMNLLLLPLALGMLILTPGYFMSLAIIVALFYLFLSSYYVPIMSMKVQSLQAFFAWYLHGSVLVFMLLVLFLALFILPLKHRLEKQKEILEHHKNLAIQNEYFMSMAGLALSSVHQLSTPLNTMALLNELLKNEVTTKEGKEYLETYAEQLKVCNQALETLRNRADYAQHNQARVVSLAEFMSELKQEFALIQQQSTLDIDIDEKLQPTEGFVLQTDPNFKLALLNLLDNAARYSPDFIQISWQLDKAFLKISIRDFGGGMSDEELAMLGQKPREQSHGLGMGVFLSRMIIERLHGSLHFCNHTGPFKGEEKQGLLAEILVPTDLIRPKETSH